MRMAIQPRTTNNASFCETPKISDKQGRRHQQYGQQNRANQTKLRSNPRAKSNRRKRDKVEPSEALQRSIGGSSRGRNPQPPTTGASVEPKSSKKGLTIADTTIPHATGVHWTGLLDLPLTPKY